MEGQDGWLEMTLGESNRDKMFVDLECGNRGR